jgi:hypothetical protein
MFNGTGVPPVRPEVKCRTNNMCLPGVVIREPSVHPQGIKSALGRRLARRLPHRRDACATKFILTFQAIKPARPTPKFRHHRCLPLYPGDSWDMY